MEYLSNEKKLEVKEKELENIKKNMPKLYHDCITKIDMYIFGAQKGFTIATEIFVIQSQALSIALQSYKKSKAHAYIEAQENKLPATSRNDYAKAKAVKYECIKIEAETNKECARYQREEWLELLNTFKKIKADNVNVRGN